MIEATLTYEPRDAAQEDESGVIWLIAEVSLDGGKTWAKTPARCSSSSPRSSA